MLDKEGVAIDIVFCPSQFACRTPKKSKILFSLHGAARTSIVTWRNPFGHWSTQSAFLAKMTKMPVVNPRLTES